MKSLLRHRIVYVSVALALSGLLGFSAGAAGFEGPGRYFSETGHTLDARFVPYFDTHGGLPLLGYPITDPFLDPFTGLLVQYLQNARLELAADPISGGLVVRLSPLGEWMGEWEARSELGEEGPGCSYFPESGHSVCHAFRTFMDAQGGPQLLGYPLSEMQVEGGRLVQYFQGFRLEWVPENPPGYQVRAAPLGMLHFNYMGYSRDLLRPIQPSFMFSYEVLQLQLRSSVSKPVVASTDELNVYIHVLDQNFRPIEGAAVTLSIQFSDEPRILLLTPTDEHGISQAVIRVESQDPGDLVELDFIVTYGTILGSTRDSFRVWW